MVSFVGWDEASVLRGGRWDEVPCLHRGLPGLGLTGEGLAVQTGSMYLVRR